jgi:hypothetical protein
MENRKASDIVITKNPGTTPSERYLAQLIRRTFLSLWSHANLFTDEGRKNGKGDGKELCDVIVIFDNHIILFSDKHCAFPEHDDITIAWRRWYHRAIEKSANQLYGAEAWLRRFPNRIFLDRKCSQPFPLVIPKVNNSRFHRIAVTRGSCDKCRKFYGGNSSGSLCINTGIEGPAQPFNIGRINPHRGYVHVLDELTLEIVLSELDTISDFVDYLDKKENLLDKSGREILATGEEQLVAMYLTNINNDGVHDFIKIPDDRQFPMIMKGYWEDLINHPQYKAKKKADEISYAWDDLIEHFIKHRDYTVGRFPNSLTDVEAVLRVLASESRLYRRVLSKQLLEVMSKDVKPGHRFTRYGTSKQFPYTGYVFLFHLSLITSIPTKNSVKGVEQCCLHVVKQPK